MLIHIHIHIGVDKHKFNVITRFVGKSDHRCSDRRIRLNVCVCWISDWSIFFVESCLKLWQRERMSEANWCDGVQLTRIQLLRFRCFWTFQLMFDEFAPTDRIDVAWSTIDPLFEVFIPTIEMKTNEIISDLSNACHANQMRSHHVHRFQFHAHCKWIRYFFLI